MHIFPEGKFEKFSNCSNGDFIYTTMGAYLYAGICIEEGGADLKLFVLMPAANHKSYNLVKIPEGNEVENFGSDWRLLTGEKSVANDEAYKIFGAVLHSSAGVFIVANTDKHSSGVAFCGLDHQDVRYPGNRPRGGFAYDNWSIEFIDEELNERLTLFSSGKPE